jgi:hypothetical protein
LHARQLKQLPEQAQEGLCVCLFLRHSNWSGARSGGCRSNKALALPAHAAKQRLIQLVFLNHQPQQQQDTTRSPRG